MPAFSDTKMTNHRNQAAQAVAELQKAVESDPERAAYKRFKFALSPAQMAERLSEKLAELDAMIAERDEDAKKPHPFLDAGDSRRTVVAYALEIKGLAHDEIERIKKQ